MQRACAGYFESAAQKQGFIQRAGALIADFKRAGVSPEQLKEYAGALPEGAEQDKFQDLALLYSAYAQHLAGQFVDGEDVLEALVARIPQCDFAQGARTLVYGFDVLTGQMCRLLLALSQCAREADVLLALGREEYFAPVLESARRLQGAAEAEGIPCRLLLLPPGPTRRAPELDHLLNNADHRLVFRIGGAAGQNKSEGQEHRKQLFHEILPPNKYFIRGLRPV